MARPASVALTLSAGLPCRARKELRSSARAGVDIKAEATTVKMDFIIGSFLSLRGCAIIKNQIGGDEWPL